VGILKIATGHIAVAHKLHQWKQREDSKCPLCGEEETVDHIFQCQHQRARAYWEEGIHDLEMFLKKKHTTPMLTSYIKGALMAWMKGNEMPKGVKISEIRHALKIQMNIGWR